MSGPSEVDSEAIDKMIEQNKKQAGMQIEPALLDRFSNLSFAEEKNKPQSTGECATLNKQMPF
jgi:hypothetical protein